jgi:hypothetical protein
MNNAPSFESVPESAWRLVYNSILKMKVSKSLDVKCSNPECRRDLVQMDLVWSKHQRTAYARANCSNCNRKVNFVALYTSAGPLPAGDQGPPPFAILQWPRTISEMPPHVAEISAAFVDLWAQAHTAERLGMADLAGMGYRKALEHLVKDFAIAKHPNDGEKIAKMALAPCIKTYLPNPTLQTAAERAAWLGNDWAHYEKRWKDADIETLKRILAIVLHHFAMVLEGERLVEAMPSPQAGQSPPIGS